MSERFGATREGEDVHRIALRNGALRANVITWGAVLQDLRLADHDAPLVLGFERFEHYPDHSPHCGAIAGRVANRIAHARFELDGRTFEVDANLLGKHQLHGGSAGFGRRVWRVADAAGAHVTLEITSPDGDMGFPGTLTARCTYRLVDPGTLRIEIEAATDAPTLCNLAHHSYFNLDGGADVLDHRLRIDADRVTPLDADLIPTGETLAVAGTPYDFRAERPIRLEVDGERFRYDVNYCLGDAPQELRTIAVARSPVSGITMETRTTEPGVQFYDAAKLDLAVPGLDGARYGPCAGFCLEAQRWPDAPNHPDFPSAVLRPGERYTQITEYRFARG